MKSAKQVLDALIAKKVGIRERLVSTITGELFWSLGSLIAKERIVTIPRFGTFTVNVRVRTAIGNDLCGADDSGAVYVTFRKSRWLKDAMHRRLLGKARRKRDGTRNENEGNEDS